MSAGTSAASAFGGKKEAAPHNLDHQTPLDALCQICSDIARRTNAFDPEDEEFKPKNQNEKHEEKKVCPRVTEEYRHHSSIEDLWRSGSECHLCSLLYVQCFDPPSGPLTLRIAYGGTQDGFRNGPLSWGIVPATISEYGFGLLVPRVEVELKLKKRQTPGSWRTASTQSDATLATARKWLNKCISTHSVCAQQGAIPQRWPKRLLMLSTSSDRKIEMHLEDCTEMIVQTPYLTLSYCWAHTDFLRLSTANYNAFKERIPFCRLPKTIRDAADITTRLGYHALWVDAFCIIQDDLQDWRSQTLSMGYIYGNSVCTIAAMVGEDCFQGCYAERRPLVCQPCRVQTGNGRSFYLEALYASPGAGLDQQTDPIRGEPHLLTRGWVFQERLLSPRTLYFTSQRIFWECCFVAQREEDGEFDTKYNLNQGPKGTFTAGLRGKISEDNAPTIQEWYDRWWKVIERFTRCDLTVPTDRWPAVAGVASIMQNLTTSPLLYGLLRAELMKDLLWESTGPPEVQRLPCQPTWSWLSVRNPVRMSGLVIHDLHNSEFTAKILRTPTPGLEDSRSIDMAITVRAPMLQCRLRKVSDDEPQHSRSSFVALSDGELNDQVRKVVEDRKWLPDIRNIDMVRDVWVLQWVKRSSGAGRMAGLMALIVQPSFENAEKWHRIGLLDVSWHGKTIKGDLLGDWKTIHLC